MFYMYIHACTCRIHIHYIRSLIITFSMDVESTLFLSTSFPREHANQSSKGMQLSPVPLYGGLPYGEQVFSHGNTFTHDNENAWGYPAGDALFVGYHVCVRDTSCRHSERDNGTVQYSTVQYSTVQYSTVQYSTVQYSTVQYSTAQHSTVQYSTAQHSTKQNN